ncbi:1-deoxy-D-xylulose-5-phosphate synthase [Halothermothrix orenii]|uniref:1-deoxy-D-xylulose-5-phosphate synthase n=1 Tax=Halothermothrix orenii (strain H 168 / OCM 544 / DSM 9562) TaxID=373903 RepID=DXS_HALOH|nr:1-deoxy-D-xylulose-5-phosphate synthase [Halothermothrix orenii]B8D2I3.1 RecName: Full=1-deoxy-D-xylulose-5-phosphate synthase; AltName: Full=1-deoxyxylulose-5-phosphate synthase; Short=DXP synthase; Short=DXPS [Halothermothrix orenii H 168]ACL69410.1 deoxyxylulose-5-phosphate synthase [Halothermothrix orenii H 168]
MGNIFDKVNSPEDLKSLNIEDLNSLAQEVRKFIIETVADTGGHLASNLGVVELTLALHYHLNSPKDKIIWDVGHQSYTHKILTGRKKKFHTIRQYKGLSGFPKYSESIHDVIETGHSSTSISAALGLALARDLKNRNDRIYAVIGDGALTGGMAFEALNHAGHLGTDIKVVLNDNAMSISKNVGALSHYLSRIRTDPTLSKFKDDVEVLLSRIPKIGNTVSRSVERVKDGLKYLFLSGVLFEEMGFTYMGPLDGHNIQELITNFKNADNIKGPVLIHVNTKKGKGYKPAESQPSKFHGVSPFKIDNGESKRKKSNFTYSQVFGQTMVKLGNKDKKIVGITAAMPEGTGLSYFKKEFPDRFFDVGIAEQHAVTLATGMARAGMKPVVAIYSTFLQRAYDQVIHDACIQNLPVTFAIDRAGIVGADGETHHGLFDLSFLRAIPNIIIMAPKNENELQHMIYTAINNDQPVAIRYPRGEGYGVELDNDFSTIPIGKGELLCDGKDVLIIAVGSRVYPAMEAARVLSQQGIKAAVINARFIKPLDKNLILNKINECKKVITVEEHALKGGFGSAILEFINENDLRGIKVKRLGLPDRFLPHGPTGHLQTIYHIDKNAIIESALKLVDERVELGLWPGKNA